MGCLGGFTETPTCWGNQGNDTPQRPDMTLLSRLQSRKALRAARVALQCATSHMPITSSMGDRPTLSLVLGRSHVQPRRTAAATPSNDATTRMALDDGKIKHDKRVHAFAPKWQRMVVGRCDACWPALHCKLLLSMRRRPPKGSEAPEAPRALAPLQVYERKSHHYEGLS